ncbi:hypothetical protein BO94DRAFT_586706 [Aspergillus sclerotioniger CBS 115572]|uniref:Uncharacterized protein n=1 Tax=Aspergillus sclerotioniger CBS 115572 TaxID=1450535 RepID=A0A317WCJ4_9EURO|nr:hypothetical protein BO94DRAFT_586706 [Aspergillus sclerotioniger CBS 115572]PWY83645.1 hypothetical protein BO94DRAFT_586706 [Aspergillus sclerotioniger CBS 115572]
MTQLGTLPDKSGRPSGRSLLPDVPALLVVQLAGVCNILLGSMVMLLLSEYSATGLVSLILGHCVLKCSNLAVIDLILL